MQEGTLELVLEGLRGIFPREKGKGRCSHWKERTEHRRKHDSFWNTKKEGGQDSYSEDPKCQLN